MIPQGGVGSVKLLYEWQTEDEARKVTVFVDSDWAGCKVSRRSVSGGIILSAGALLKAWSNRHASTAMSSAEAEFYAASKAAAELMGIQSLFADMGGELTVVLEDGDSTFYACNGTSDELADHLNAAQAEGEENQN